MNSQSASSALEREKSALAPRMSFKNDSPLAEAMNALNIKTGGNLQIDQVTQSLRLILPNYILI
jgi:hypothetical protein